MQPGKRFVFVAPPGAAPDAAFQRATRLARGAGGVLTVFTGHDTVRPSWTDGMEVDIRPLPDGPWPEALCRELPRETLLVMKVARTHEARGWVSAKQADWRFLRCMPCPVWFLPRGPAGGDGAVLATVELPGGRPDDLDREVVQRAASLARWEGAQLHIVHPWSLVGDSVLTSPLRGLGPIRARRFLRRMGWEREQGLRSFLSSEGLGDQVGWTVEYGPAPGVIRHVVRAIGGDVLVAGFTGCKGVWGLLEWNLLEGFLGIRSLSVVGVRAGVVAAAPEPLVGAGSA